jgi:outer membrane immunogenic protein
MKKLILATALGAAMASPAFAQEETGNTSMARDGFRIEARATYETPTVSSIEEEGDVFKIGSAFAFGGEAGYDFAVSDTVVVGPYAQYEFSTVESCEEGLCLSANGYLEAGLHVGLATSADGQFYGKVGYAEQDYTFEGAGLDVTDKGSGFAFALGYEHSFGENFYGRVEGGYADLGEVFTINTQRRHFGVALGARF